MAGLLEKIRIGVLATAHSLADQVIDLNSAAAVKQYIRDLENSLSRLKDASAEATGYTRTLAREEEHLEAQIEELNHNIQFILSDGDESNDHLAIPLEARLMGLEENLRAKQAEATEAHRTAQALSEVVSQLSAKHASMVANLQRIEAMERTAKAKESAARTLEQVGRMTGSGAGAVSVDDVAARLQRRADVADVKLEQAMGGVRATMQNDVLLAQAQARLAARKAQMAGEQPHPPAQTGEPDDFRD